MKNFNWWEWSTRKYNTGIFSTSPPFNELHTFIQEYIDKLLSKVLIFLYSSLIMTPTTKYNWWNASSIIFIIESTSILLELPLKLFGKSCSYTFSTLLYAALHFWKSFEYRNISITTLDITQLIKKLLLYESYIPSENLFWHQISYVTVRFTLF